MKPSATDACRELNAAADRRIVRLGQALGHVEAQFREQIEHQSLIIEELQQELAVSDTRTGS